MTVRTLLKATDVRVQSLKISPLPPLITGDPLPRFIPGPLNLQKHWATLLKVLLLTDLCVLYHYSAVSVLGAYKRCRVRRATSGSSCSVVY